MKIQRVWWLGMVMGSVFSLPASAALVDRGNGLVLDTVLKVYWLQDASLGGNGTFTNAEAWADSLEFGGLTNWRLPSLDANSDGMTVDNCAIATELACRDNELGYMYYFNLTPAGDIPPTDPRTDLTGDQDPIQKIQRYHWAFGRGGQGDAYFDFATGFQSLNAPGGRVFAAWAVHPVPVPAAVWLFGSGIIGLIGIARRKTRA